MITVTENALDFILHSAEAGGIDLEETGLRIAIKEASDGGYDYGIGFDEEREQDVSIPVKNLKILINEDLREYLEDATLDFVDLEENGQMSLIVLNPNDPTFVAPRKERKPR